MATIPVNDTEPRNQYTAAASQTVFDYDFIIFSEGDLDVYVNDVLQTITTDYTVTGVNDPNGGTVVFVNPRSAGEIITIEGNIAIERLTDFQQGGQFDPDDLNEEQDKQIAMMKQIKRDLDRKLGLTTTSQVAAPNLVLQDDPEDGKLLVWDGLLGNIRNSVDTIADIENNLSILAPISGDITTVAGISSDVTAVAADSVNIGTVATNIANVNTVATDIANVNAVAANQTNIDAVAGNATNINTVAGNTANINTVAGNTTNINTVAANDANVTTVAGISADITTVANIASDVTDAANNIPKANRTATVDPTVNNDSTEFYSEGSQWVNTTTDRVFVMTDPTAGAAVWKDTTASSPVDSVNGQTGVVVLDLDDIDGVDLTTTPPVSGDNLQYDGTNWIPAAAGGGGLTGFAAVPSAASIAPNTHTVVTSASEEWDPDSDYDPVTGRYTPSTAGKYLFAHFNGFGSLASGTDAIISLRKNGGGSIYISWAGSPNTIQTNTTSFVVLDMNGTTDYVEALVRHNDAVNRFSVAQGLFYGIRLGA